MISSWKRWSAISFGTNFRVTGLYEQQGGAAEGLEHDLPSRPPFVDA
jgi:hypothetical protein